MVKRCEPWAPRNSILRHGYDLRETRTHPDRRHLPQEVLELVVHRAYIYHAGWMRMQRINCQGFGTCLSTVSPQEVRSGLPVAFLG